MTKMKKKVWLQFEVIKRRRPYARAQTIATDVGTLTSEEIDNKMRELYERTDEGWRCLVCDHTSKGPTSSDIRRHVETHLEGLVYTCNLCSQSFRLRNSLAKHK